MRVRFILVRQNGGGNEILAAQSDQTEHLNIDPDTALESVRSHFKEKWRAKVHALRWIFPHDFLIPSTDSRPFLVLYVDEIGQIPIREGIHTDRASPCSTQEAIASSAKLVQKEAIRRIHSEPWSAPAWLDEVSNSLAAALHTTAIQRIFQVRVASSGAVLKVQSTAGTYFVKTLPPYFRQETRLLPVLANCIPGACATPVSCRGFTDTHITAAIDGSPLRNINDARYWETALNDVAEMQRKSAEHIQEIRSAGVPYQTFLIFCAEIERMLAQLAAMQTRARNCLRDREKDRLSALAAKAIADCEVLRQCGIPETINHGDVSESNIFRTSSRTTTLIDWTFARIGHPFLGPGLLFLTYERTHQMHSVSATLRRAYLDPWRRYASPERLRASLAAASRLFWIESAQYVGRVVRKQLNDLPGTIGYIPSVLRRALQAYRLAT